ncbi:hypothetical protein [Pseudorhizobium flavum]|uniref:hypothetical protein n=1 Tax=Pseudorhizobium flavum TaxID=1335061 RepID=UPI0037700042
MSTNINETNLVAATPVALSINGEAKRGYYNEITSIKNLDGSTTSASEILKLFEGVLPESFVEFDKKMRGDSLNLDVYGYDAEQGVAVIQIRHFFKRYAKGFANIHKDYVLVGRNEITNELFRHPVSAHAVHAGIRKDEDDPVSAVRSAQRWMWGVNDKQLAAGVRQGDVLMVPASKPANADKIEAESVVVGGSHEVRSNEFLKSSKGMIFAFAPRIKHTKDQHDMVFANEDRWYSIRVAEEASTWEWGVRLGD